VQISKYFIALANGDGGFTEWEFLGPEYSDQDFPWLKMLKVICASDGSVARPTYLASPKYSDSHQRPKLSPLDGHQSPFQWLWKKAKGEWS
jgi:hypothetical protein